MSSLYMTSIIRACQDPGLFQPWFKRVETWRNWRVFLRALFGLPFAKGDRVIFEKCTGRTRIPKKPFTEAWLVVGRRGGKSFILALIAVFLAFFRDWRPYLQPGEKGTIVIIAADRKQARVIFRFIDGLIMNIPLLKKDVYLPTSADAINLKNDIVIEIHTASFRSVRGYVIVAALLDEIAFWRDEKSANPDTEVLDALRPGMATVPGSMLICASSPYSKRGVLHDVFAEYFGKETRDVLVWKASTKMMNPTISDKVIDRAYERDPVVASAEYGGEFRTDVEAFMTREVVNAATSFGTYERPYIKGIRYFGFVDPSGGSQDSFTLAIAHAENGIPILDVIREKRPPFNPETVVTEFSSLAKEYKLTYVVGDHYGGEWPRVRFKSCGIQYRLSKTGKSALYVEILPEFNAGLVEILDVVLLRNQFLGLERQTSRKGKDSVDHKPGGRDDLCNSATGALVCATNKTVEIDSSHFRVGPRLVSSQIEDMEDMYIEP